MQYDIEEFFILQFQGKLLLKVLTYAKTIVNISDEENNTIMHSRKSLLSNNTDVWIKKNGDPGFDVILGAIVGASGFMYSQHFGLKVWKTYISFVPRSACFQYTKALQADRIRKDVMKIFKEDFNLTITCETNCQLPRCNHKLEYW